jgi:predicted amidohydrolase YtcJ
MHIDGIGVDIVLRADLVLVGGNVLTMNPSQPSAEAIAVKGDRIVKVGTNGDITQWVGKNTRVINLDGKTVIPGFIDTHIHIADFGRTLTWLDLKNVNSIKTLQDKIKQKAQATPKGKWILGSGWNQDNLKEKRAPTKHDLDEASPDNPVTLYHQLGRTCTVNSKALELAGVTKETTSPKGGTIDKNPETGEPTGILHGNATDLIWNKIPPPTEQETLEATKNACQKIIEAGITSAHWIICSTTELAIAKKLTLENNPPLRIYTIITANLLETLPNAEPTENTNHNPAKVDAVLIFADGYLASQTAALNEPYKIGRAHV